MTRSVRNAHTLSRRLHSQAGPVRSSVDTPVVPSIVFPANPSSAMDQKSIVEIGEEEAADSSVAVDRPCSGQSAIAQSRVAGHRAGTTALLLGGDVCAMAVLGVATHADVTLHALVCAIILAVSAHQGLYRGRLTVSILDDLPRLAVCLAAGPALGCLLRPEIPSAEPAITVSGALVVGTGLVASRAATYSVLRWLRTRLWLPGNVTLIVGTGQIGRRLGQAMLDHPEHGLRLVGYLDDERRRQARPPAPLLGRTHDLDRLIGELGISHVVVTFGTVRVATLVDVVRTCDRLRCEILLVPRLFELHTSTRDTEHVQGLPLVRMRRAPFRQWRWRAKRVIDVVVAAVLFVLVAPVLLACAVAVRLEGGPGVLFRQERVGLDGRRFQMLKFRSLRPSSEAESQLRWTIARDPRMGPVGRLLRTTSLDELPQLVNVLRGDMSLVGPRPERPHFVEQLSRAHPRYHARLRVPAGLTGWAAVHGLRGDTSISDRVRFDNAYIQNWSLWLDVKILLRTIGAVLGRTGA